MRIWATRLTAILLGLSMLLTAVPGARAAAPAPPPPPAANGSSEAIGRTPPRLSYLNGDVSFWRPGAPDWGAKGIAFPETDVAAGATRLVIIQADGSGRQVPVTLGSSFDISYPRWLQ